MITLPGLVHSDLKRTARIILINSEECGVGSSVGAHGQTDIKPPIVIVLSQ